jgi:hypothetical protein
LVERFLVERFFVERFLAPLFLPDRFLADFLAPFFLAARFLVDFFAAFRFFAIGCGSFRSSAHHTIGLSAGALTSGERHFKRKDNGHQVCERLLLAAIVVNGCQTTEHACISARIEPSIDGARQVESEKNRVEEKVFFNSPTSVSDESLAMQRRLQRR